MRTAPLAATSPTPGSCRCGALPTSPSYAAGTAAIGGYLEIADVVLAGPAPGATVALPATFQWVKRMPRSGEGYRHVLVKLDGSGQYAMSSPLGYVNSFTLSSLPGGFGSGTPHGWGVFVYDGLGGVGASYYARAVTFGTAAARQPALESEGRNVFRDGIEAMRAGASPMRIEEH